MYTRNGIFKLLNKQRNVNCMHKRNIAGILARLTSRLFKLRYLIIGGTGGYAVNKV